METIKLKLGDKLYKALASYNCVLCMEYTVVEVRTTPEGEQYVLESLTSKEHPSVRLLVVADRGYVSYVRMVKDTQSHAPAGEWVFHKYNKGASFMKTPSEAMRVYVKHWGLRCERKIEKQKKAIAAHQAKLVSLNHDISGLRKLLEIGVASPTEEPEGK